MKLKKLTGVLIILITLLILTNTIYASEVDAAENENKDTNTETITNDEINEHVNSYYVRNNNELTNAFDSIYTSEEKYHEINLTKRRYNLQFPFDCSYNLEIEKIIKINGNDSIISGKNEKTFASIPSLVTLNISNLTIANMNCNYGGAINNMGTLITNNVTFENNTSYENEFYGGGAIRNSGFMNLTESIFRNNTSNNFGSSVFSHQNGKNETTIYLNNCIFEEERNFDSIIYNEDSLIIINNSVFKNCNSEEGSIIVNNKNKTLIHNSVFENENCSKIAVNKNECQLLNISINNSNFNIIFDNSKIKEIKNNTESIYGLGFLLIKNSTIHNNTANSILYSDSHTAIYNSTISNNNIINSTLTNIQRGLSENPYMEIRDSQILNNIANNASGAKNDEESCRLLVDNTLFQNNTSYDNGVLNDLSGETLVINSRFHNNTANELFIGNAETFPLVTDNEYLGNNLGSNISYEYSKDEDNILVMGSISTNSIYNTSVNLGKIYLYQEDNLLSYSNINNGLFTISTGLTNEDSLILNLYYDGETHYKKQNISFEISASTGEYSITISNVTPEYVYGDLISYVVLIENTGDMAVRNIRLENLVPNGLIYLNSSENLNLDNSITINQVDVNEIKSISFNATPIRYDNLNLTFNILDVNNNSFIHEQYHITFIKPSISINNLIAHAGDVINITAKVTNYNKGSIDKVQLKFQYKNVENINVLFNNNEIRIINFKLDDRLIKKDYNIELICNDSRLDNTFSNKSKISIIKLNTYSTINSDVSNNHINISARIFDENDNLIESGYVTLKINKKTVKTITITNGTATLNDFVISRDYINSEYNISIVFIGSNKYNTSSNNTIVAILKENPLVSMNYELNENLLIIRANVTSQSDNRIEGEISIKINGKSMTSKTEINNSEMLFTIDISDIRSIDIISLYYYGSNNFNYQTIDLDLKDKGVLS